MLHELLAEKKDLEDVGRDSGINGLYVNIRNLSTGDVNQTCLVQDIESRIVRAIYNYQVAHSNLPDRNATQELVHALRYGCDVGIKLIQDLAEMEGEAKEYDDYHLTISVPAGDYNTDMPLGDVELRIKGGIQIPIEGVESKAVKIPVDFKDGDGD